jgi:hypothetical protein
MSYSRWINSDFYTYWCSSNVYDKQDELFACHTSIDHQYMFTYTECKAFIEDPKTLKSRITEYELEENMLIELCTYMDEFISDVDLRYERDLIELRGGQ